jgi:TctA family transporter
MTCNPPYPPEYTCTVQQPSVSLSPGLSVVFTFTLSPSYTAGVNARSRSNQIVLAVFLPVSLFSLIGLARKRRATLRALLLTSVLAILGSFTTACGPDHFIPITTGIYPITFTATGTSQGSTTPITHTLTLSADITP